MPGRNDLERLREEARYHRERRELYRARLYAGRAISQDKLRRLQRASDGADARLRRAEERVLISHGPAVVDQTAGSPGSGSTRGLAFRR